MTAQRDQLDPRAWLLWAVAAGLPPLLGRNPFVLGAVLLACLGVRGAVVQATANAASWRWLLRLAVVFAAIGTLFNLLTVHIGDQPIATVPRSIPIFGGMLTWNALVYGLLSGLAILTLVVIGVTLAACLDQAELLRLLPGRLTSLAVAGSVALVFLPQTVTAFHEIREAQQARGYRLRGARGLLPLIVPLLTGGLERALTLAEALEARGFGALIGNSDEFAITEIRRLPRGAKAPALCPRAPLNHESRWRSVVTALGLTACAVGGYLLAVGSAAIGLMALATGVLAVALAGRESQRQRGRRTRYRQPDWSRRDSMVVIAALVTLVVEIIILRVDAAAFQYQPYPSFSAPVINLWLLAALGLLLMPAIVAPAATAPHPAGESVQP